MLLHKERGEVELDSRKKSCTSWQGEGEVKLASRGKWNASRQGGEDEVKLASHVKYILKQKISVLYSKKETSFFNFFFIITF